MAKEPRCAYCGGVIAYKPYVETIDKKEMTFHAKACAVAYKKSGSVA